MPCRIGKSFHKFEREIALAIMILTELILSVGILPAQESTNSAGIRPRFNIQEQTACETHMLREMGGREVFSGKTHRILAEVARAYGRPTPHIYLFPGSLNMAYIAGSTAVDGRGKIVVGQQAVEVFDAFSIEGFLGHEMAHLVSDNAAQRCTDYIVRNPQTEADADALAAHTLGTSPLRAFLQQVLTLTKGQNWDAKHRLEVLR